MVQTPTKDYFPKETTIHTKPHVVIESNRTIQLNTNILLGSELNRLMAVSYTHLDVYKRQPLYKVLVAVKGI